MAERAVRASDGERERVVAVLRDQAAEGRITLEEFEQRMDAAYDAKTWGDLSELTRDLPVEISFADGDKTSTDTERNPRGRTVQRLAGRPDWLLPVLVVATVAGVVVSISSGTGFPWLLIGLFWVFGGGGCSARRSRSRVHASHGHARPPGIHHT